MHVIKRRGSFNKECYILNMFYACTVSMFLSNIILNVLSS